MILVTLDGRVMVPGVEHDYTLREDGKPEFHKDHRLHHDSVVQVICTDLNQRRVYQGTSLAEIELEEGTDAPAR